MRTGPEKPSHNVVVQMAGDPRTPNARKIYHTVGVAWLNEETQALTIKLNPFIDLGRMGPGDVLRAFHKDHVSRKERGAAPAGYPPPAPPPRGEDPGPSEPDPPPDFGDDDVPF